MTGNQMDERLNRSYIDGIHWLLRVRGSEARYPSHDLVSHYKSPLLLAEGGLVAEGTEVLSWLVTNYMTDANHFYDKEDRAARGRYCDLYEDLWIAWGASRLSSDDLARSIFGFCLCFFDEDHGGFASRVAHLASDQSQLYDLRSTSLAGVVALELEELDAATAAARWVTDLIQGQKDDAGFFMVRDQRGEIVRTYPPNLARIFVVPKRVSPFATPLHYALALAIIFLVKIYDSTARDEYLTTAREYASLCVGQEPAILRNHYSGKLAWGLALLAGATGEDSYLSKARAAINYILSNQQATGQWSVPTLFPKLEQQPLPVTIDRTAEYTLLAKYIRDSFQSASDPTLPRPLSETEK